MPRAALALLGLALGAARARSPPPPGDAERPARYASVGPPAPPNVRLPWGPAGCFVSETWRPEEVVKVANVEYGIAYHPYKSANITLLMDVFFPPASDARGARPAVVLLHGGGFIEGEREDEVVQAGLLAMRGYVVATVKYRRVPMLKSWLLWSAEPAVLAMEDARAGVRFMRKKAAEWRVDTTRIAIGGESAGAIASLYYAYVRRNSDGSPATEGESGNPGYSSVVNAVVSISGAMVDRAFCAHVGAAPAFPPSLCLIPGPPISPDLTPNVDAGSIPGIDMHGTADQVIPYAGGAEWASTMAAKGAPHSFLSVPGAGHTPKDILFDPKQPYLVQWLTFLSGALNLREAACPARQEEPVLV